MINTFIRTIILYATVMIAMRIMGKKQIGQLQPAEFVVAMMISDLATVPMGNAGAPILDGVIPILGLISVEILGSALLLKSRFFRRVLEGKPCIIIQHGQLDLQQMRKVRYNIDDVMEELRGLGYSDIRDIEYGILETGGALSVIPSFRARAALPADLGVPETPTTLSFAVISDGKIVKDNLPLIGTSQKEVEKLLKDNKIGKIEDVFFAALDQEKSFHYQLYPTKGKVKAG